MPGRRSTEAKIERARLRWHFLGVAFTDEQGAVLRAVTDEHRLSLAEVLDRCFERYLPARWGVEWPAAPRSRRRWRLHEHKLKPPDRHRRNYGVLITAAQQAALARAVQRAGRAPGVQSAIVEEAFATELGRVFPGHVWPPAYRHMAIGHRRYGGEQTRPPGEHEEE